MPIEVAYFQRGSVRNEFILEDVEVDDDDEEESEDDGWGEIEKNEKHEVGLAVRHGMFRTSATRYCASQTKRKIAC